MLDTLKLMGYLFLVRDFAENNVLQSFLTQEGFRTVRVLLEMEVQLDVFFLFT